MTDSTESGQPSGAQGTPSPQASTEEGQHTYVDAKEFESVRNELQRLEKMVSSFQSGKDKGINRIEGRLGEQDERIDRILEYVKGGMTPADAKRQATLDDMLADYSQRTGSGVGGGKPDGSGDHQPSLDEQAILTQLGLDPNDEQVTAILREKQDDVERIAAYANLAIQRKTQAAPTPTPAQQMPTGGGTTPPNDMKARTERLNEILKNPHLHTQAEINEASEALERLIRSQ